MCLFYISSSNYSSVLIGVFSWSSSSVSYNGIVFHSIWSCSLCVSISIAFLKISFSQKLIYTLSICIQSIEIFLLPFRYDNRFSSHFNFHIHFIDAFLTWINLKSIKRFWLNCLSWQCTSNKFDETKCGEQNQKQNKTEKKKKKKREENELASYYVEFYNKRE